MDFKVSTAVSITVGPVLDAAGLEYAGAVIGDFSYSKNGATPVAFAAAATRTLIANGYYTLAMIAGNVDTIGNLQIICNKVGYQMPPIYGSVKSAIVFGGLVDGTDNLTVDAIQIDGSTLSAQNLAKSTKGILFGTCSTFTTTTTINTTGFPVSGIELNQFLGRTIVFLSDTGTPALRGQATRITGSSIATNPVFTVDAMTEPPSAGDVFVMV